jgi:hypothetical protein
MIKRIIFAAMLAASVVSVATPAAAAIVVRIAPPPPREEVVPPPRAGYVWGAGHWEWRHGHHEWVKGTWIRERRGYRYVQPTWAQHDGRWSMEGGGWKHGDSDGDGVPNGRDRAPNDPRRN